MVKVLTQRPDVNVNSLSISQRCLLFWPSFKGHVSVVDILLEANADPSLEDENGDTAVTVV